MAIEDDFMLPSWCAPFAKGRSRGPVGKQALYPSLRGIVTKAVTIVSRIRGRGRGESAVGEFRGPLPGGRAATRGLRVLTQGAALHVTPQYQAGD
jgi:hypothetical protein